MNKTTVAIASALAIFAAGAASSAFAKGGPGFGLTTATGSHINIAGGPRHPAGTPLACVSPVGKTSNGDPFSGDPNNSVVELNIGVGNEMTGAAADASIEAFSPSWLSETAVLFSSTDPADPNAINLTVSATDASGVEEITTNGVLLFADFSLPNIPAGPDGILRLEWFETFDDASISPDNAWSNAAAPFTCQGIYITCTDQAACDAAVGGGGGGQPPAPTRELPTLSQWALGLLVAGLGLLAFRSRKRFVRNH